MFKFQSRQNLSELVICWKHDESNFISYILPASVLKEIKANLVFSGRNLDKG